MPTKKKAPKGPKKPLSPYVFYSKEQRPLVKAEHPELAFGDIGKFIAQQWKELSNEDKQKYQELADQDKQRYKLELVELQPKEAIVETETQMSQEEKKLKNQQPNTYHQ